MAATVSCGSPPAPVSLDRVANDYILLTRGLALHDRSLVDHWLQEPSRPLGPREPVHLLRARIDEAGREAERAVTQAESAEAEARARHLHGQLRALSLAARRLLGESLPFDAEARLGLGIDPARANQLAAAAAREALDRALPGKAPLVERVASFRARFRVPEARGEDVMARALDACRAATQHAMPLPPDEAIEVAFVPALPWDAHARYLGAHRTRIEVNASRPLDLTRALRLACHEGYAGHHAQYIWTADELVGRRGWPEFSLVPGFGPDLLVAEGAAEAGTDLAMPPRRRLEVYRDRLAPAAGLPLDGLDLLVEVEEHLAVIEPLVGDIARDYLDNRVNTSGTVARLASEALVADAEPFATFIEQRRTRVLAYTEGRRLVLRQAGDEGLAGLLPLLATGLSP